MGTYSDVRGRMVTQLVVSGVNLAMIAKGRLGDWGTGGEEEEMVRLFPPPSTSYQLAN